MTKEKRFLYGKKIFYKYKNPHKRFTATFMGNLSVYIVPSAGIEPTSQASEARVLSVTLRGQFAYHKPHYSAVYDE